MVYRSIASHRNTISALGQLAFNVAALAIVYFSYSQNEPSVNKILIPIFILFASTFIVDKVGGVFSGYSFDRDHLNMERLYEELPNILVGNHDIVTFPSRIEGLKYATYLCEFSSHVRNTVIRYGSNRTSTAQDEEYMNLLKAKKKSLKDNDCVWTEILSDYLGDDDPAIKLVNEIQNTTRYYVCYVDDVHMPMVQMFIFEFTDRDKEVIFGWEFPGMEQGASFATRNRKIVDYFETYFEYCRREFGHANRVPRGPLAQSQGTNRPLVGGGLVVGGGLPPSRENTMSPDLPSSQFRPPSS
jgi:hypothetical protein